MRPHMHEEKPRRVVRHMVAQTRDLHAARLQRLDEGRDFIRERREFAGDGGLSVSERLEIQHAAGRGGIARRADGSVARDDVDLLDHPLGLGSDEID